MTPPSPWIRPEPSSISRPRLAVPTASASPAVSSEEVSVQSRSERSAISSAPAPASTARPPSAPILFVRSASSAVPLSGVISSPPRPQPAAPHSCARSASRICAYGWTLVSVLAIIPAPVPYPPSPLLLESASPTRSARHCRSRPSVPVTTSPSSASPSASPSKRVAATSPHAAHVPPPSASCAPPAT